MSVLLRAARIALLQGDPRIEPAHRQPRQTARARAGKGRPVVRTDRLGQPVALEDLSQPTRQNLLSFGFFPETALDI